MTEVNKVERDKAESWFLEMVERSQDNPITGFVEVTPARATVLLENNKNNRTIAPSKLIQLEDDMRHQRYQVNGEAIIVNKEGELNDGQHRLKAILNTGLSQVINLVFGTSKESRDTIDIGKARNAGHVLTMEGKAYGAPLSAATRKIISFKRFGTFGNNSRISAPEILEFARTDELLDEITAWAHTHQAKFRGFKLTPSDIAVLYYVLAEKHAKQARVFMEAVRDGLHLAVNSPIHTLRQTLINRPKLASVAKMEIVIRAWNAWIRDKEIANIPVMGKMPEILGPKMTGRSRIPQPKSADK